MLFTLQQQLPYGISTGLAIKSLQKNPFSVTPKIILDSLDTSYSTAKSHYTFFTGTYINLQASRFDSSKKIYKHAKSPAI